MKTLQIHPQDPQVRLLNQVVEIIKSGGVIVYPTDSGYALGCCVGNKEGALRIRQIRQLDEKHNFTLVCHDLSELATYAKVDNTVFRFLKAHTPGPYTFILPATKEAPKRLVHEKRKTVGIRIPDNKIALRLLEILGEPIMSVSFLLPEDELDGRIDLIIDGGFCGNEPTTMIDFAINPDGTPKVIRQGSGKINFL